MALSENKTIGCKKWILLLWAVFEIVLFSGVVFGWGVLVFVLKDEGLYSDLCQMAHKQDNNTRNESTDHSHATIEPNGTLSVLPTPASTSTSEVTIDGVCKPQDEKMALCFTIASALFCVTAPFIGHISYKFGTRVYRLIAFATFTCGALMMAFANNDIPWLIYPGTLLMAVGGLPLLISNTQIANLFDRGRSTIVVCLNGVYIISSGVQLLVKLLHERGVSRQNTYIVIVCLHSLTLVSTFGFLPKTFIPIPDGPLMVQQTVELKNEELVKEKQIQNSTPRKDQEDQVKPGKKHGLLRCIKQPLFVTECTWFCILTLKFLYFTGITNIYLNRNLDNDKEKVSLATDIWIYIMIGGALPVSFLAGSIYDWQKYLYNGHSATYQSLMPAVLPHAIGCLVYVAFCVLTVIPSPALVYPVFFLITAGRAFLYGLALAFLSVVFPSEYTSFLFGFLFFIGGIIGFLQYALFAWAEAYPDGPLHGEIVLLVLVLISFVHPFYIWLTCKRADQASRKANQTNN